MAGLDQGVGQPGGLWAMSRLIAQTDSAIPLENTQMGGYKQVHLFISYAHADSTWMESIRKELQAALFGKAIVWCDRDIEEGGRWEETLKQKLGQCDIALVLVTSDYLISPWCRRELRYIERKVQEKRIKKLLWVQLKPCVWERTPLAAFQSKLS